MANIEGAITGNVMEVDSNDNLKINIPIGQTQSGYFSGMMDYDIAVQSLYSRKHNFPFVTYDRRLSVGLDTPYFDYSFNATAQDTGVWRYVTATMSTTWGTGGMLMNAISTVTTATGTAVSTWRTFPLTAHGTISVDMSLSITAAPLMGQVVEFGLFPFGAGTAAPTEGVYFRFTNAGLIGVVNYNGTETTTGVMIPSTLIPPNVVNDFTIRIHERLVQFLKEGILLYNAEMPTNSSQGQPFITTELPLTFQFRNSGTVNGAIVMQLKVNDAAVEQKSLNIGKQYSHNQASKGLMGYQGTNGGTMGTTASYANNLAAGAGTILSNTATLITGLGGQGGALGTLAVPTDGIVCSFQIPAGGVNQTPRMLYLTGVKVNCGVTTVLAGGPMLYAMSLAFGHSAVSMATAEAIAGKAPRRVPLGFLSLAANAAAGAATPELYIPFNTPIVVSPGEFVAVVAKNLGTVTTTGVINFHVTYDCYWE